MKVSLNDLSLVKLYYDIKSSMKVSLNDLSLVELYYDGGGNT